LGKVLGVVGATHLVMKIAGIGLPTGMNNTHLLGAGFLAAIGFTMSLFISGLAFDQQALADQAKIGILTASLVASVAGYFIIKKACDLSAT
jgi:NhaA family Na+:H+ antiporter